jgi:hypothetical protein
VDVSVDRDAAGDVVIKIAAPEWEINVTGSLADLLALDAIAEADWSARRSIGAGRSVSAPVWWSSDGTVTTIMVGPDDETWDIAVTVPLGTIAEIVRRLRDCAADA